jgi:hypothetical protein
MSTLTANPAAPHPSPRNDTHAPPVHDTVTVYPWSEPRFEQWGHHVQSDYVERFWLPILGPSSIVLARHIAANFDSTNTAFESDTHTMAGAIGIAPGQLLRVINRLVSFGKATFNPGTTSVLALRTHWEPLGPNSIRRLPAHLAELHRDTETVAEQTHYSTQTQRAIWRFVLSAHANGTSVTDIDTLLRHRECEQSLRVEFVNWCRNTPRHQRP